MTGRSDDDGRADATQTNDAARPIKLLQGYLWHPREMELDFEDYLPTRLEPDIHVLWDEMPHAPFTFFDDGTLASSQRIYQFTALVFDEDEETAARLVPWLAETLQAALETTPAGVGWQVMEDLRPIE